MLSSGPGHDDEDEGGTRVPESHSRTSGSALFSLYGLQGQSQVIRRGHTHRAILLALIFMFILGVLFILNELVN